MVIDTAMPLLFFDLSRESGLSWVAYTYPDVIPTAVSGTVTELAAAAISCSAIVGLNARKKMEAIVKIAPQLDGKPIIELTQGASIKIAIEAYYADDFAHRAPKSILPKGISPSTEQWAVITAAEAGYNIQCRAVAGAGKSTTLLMCAARRPQLKHLLLTYNKRLQLEVSKRAPSNVTALTYHAAAGRAYGTVVRNDDVLGRVVKYPPESAPRFDMIMLDEAQDMRIDYFALVRHLIRDNPGSRVIIVGDELQSINVFRGAHPGFLRDAPEIYRGIVAGPWTSCRLAVSYRLTPATAAFVNTHLYRAPVLIGGNTRTDNRLPIYIAEKKKEDIITSLLSITRASVEEFGPDGVFVLAPSVRGLGNKKSPIAELVRRLTDVPLFVSSDDDSGVDDDLVRGKLAILSFNTVKGCERDCVIIVGLDETYFKYFARDFVTDPLDPMRLPNVLTVAATRAIKLLVMVNSASSTLRSITRPQLDVHASIRGAPGNPRRSKPQKRKKQIISVTDLIRHLHPDTMVAAMELVLPTPMAAHPTHATDFNTKVKFARTMEDMSSVYGILSTTLAEVSRTGTTNLATELETPQIVNTPEELNPNENQILSTEYKAYPEEFWENISSALSSACKERSFEEWATLTLAEHAFRDGRHHVARQVTHYNWVNADALFNLRDTVLSMLNGIEGQFETRIAPIKIGDVEVVGRADFIANDGTIWEFKLGALCQEHELQLACYLALLGGGEGVLASILQGEKRAIYVAPTDANEILRRIIERGSADVGDVVEKISKYDENIALETVNYDDAKEAYAEEDAFAWDASDAFA